MRTLSVYHSTGSLVVTSDNDRKEVGSHHSAPYGACILVREHALRTGTECTTDLQVEHASRVRGGLRTGEAQGSC
jgi:hypothetical protein